jgi:hypothetical protein
MYARLHAEPGIKAVSIHPLESLQIRKDSRSQAGDRVEVRHIRTDNQSERRTQIRGKNHNTNE